MPVLGLVLSLFPGLDLLGRAFEAAGWCVVRGPDVLWAQDVREWTSVSGRFDGVIGGPPCQKFSKLAALVRSQGLTPRFGNLIPEFERVVSEATPSWWLMEEVTGAPLPCIKGYCAESTVLSPRDLGDPQSRDRRITVGVAAGMSMVDLTGRLPALSKSQDAPIPAVTGSGTLWERRPGRLSRPGPTGTRSWAVAESIARVQGYPGIDKELRGTSLWTAKGVCQAIGNGVPRVMGDALATAITEWWLNEEVEA